ncbi:TetR/AcrR family transcriptional regulator [Nocardioides sp.]|uniref:TetR/AcrR family transcriptional regulator n=1 Tax=Nocardioides sp. TaxID=35761 RepID=UPI0026358A3E|nr:TetR/AcrR family transcriptional regulator [Nocardioides sp.]
MDRPDSRPAGRPRDADADDRIIDAALAEYAAHGHAGYSLNGVARRAGVGKSSIYLRWTDKESLLVGAVHARAEAPSVDTGSLRGDLEAVVSWLLRHFLSEVGWVAVRIAIDGVETDSRAPRPEKVGAQHALVIQDVWERAVRRGEVDPGHAGTWLRVTRMMYGDLLLDAMLDRGRLRRLDEDERAAEARDLVDLMMRLLER